MVCLQDKDRILLSPFAEQISYAQSKELTQIILDIAESNESVNIDYADDMEFELLSTGIKDLEDRGNLTLLHQKLGYTYVLKVLVTSQKDSEGYDHQSYEEANALYPVYRSPLEVYSTVKFILTETKTGENVANFDVVTSVGEVSKGDSDGGRDYYNFGTAYSSVRTAVKNGTKYLIADCNCPKGKYVKWSNVMRHF